MFAFLIWMGGSLHGWIDTAGSGEDKRTEYEAQSRAARGSSRHGGTQNGSSEAQTDRQTETIRWYINQTVKPQ